MRNHYRRSSRRGFALLLVLIMVSFAAAIAVLFLLSARQERVGTDSYAQGSRVRQLSDTAVNIVIGQINAATREGTAATPISWASQPGMIRTYNQNGNLSYAYKLYSWNHMIEGASAGTTGDSVAPAFDPFGATELPPASWASESATFTDLNAPVTSSIGGNPVSVYPIIDPAIANTSTSKSAPATVNNTSSPQIQWDFPNELAYIKDSSIGYNAVAGGNPLPMPVQWLYVLQDGTWLYPSSTAGNSVTFDSGIVTTSNPIVGRIAFWTDDETCKVNLNTAGEGAYWDWPKAATQDEMQFAGNPPAKNEFYRISGHPASTSLSAVFPEMMSGSTGVAGAGFTRWDYTGAVNGYGVANPSYITGLKRILGGDAGSYVPGLTPRYSFGTGAFIGSQGGTYPCPYYQIYDPLSTVTAGTFIDNSNYKSYSNYSPVNLFYNGPAYVSNPTSPRLYATPDEVFFSAQQNPNNGRGSALGGALLAASYENPALYNLTTGAMTPLQVAQRGFLVTTTSKAPETTLFNTPRVSMWPITWPYPNSYYARDVTGGGLVNGRGTAPAAPTTFVPNSQNLSYLATTAFGTSGAITGIWITPQEDLIAYCSTLNVKATGLPSAGTYTGAPLPYYFQRQVLDSPTSDWTNIARNEMLANYIRGMIHQQVPGFGKSLEQNWGVPNADWIALECMDYCRSMINQFTYNPNDPNGTLMYSFTGQATSNPGAAVERSAYSVPPLRISSTMLSPSAIPASSNNFKGTPINVTTVPGMATASPAYVTQGSFPSLKEAALVFYATGRNLPSYRGAPPLPTGTAPNMIADPFYWANLINPGNGTSPVTGAPYGGIPAPPNTGTPWLVDGLTTNAINGSAAMENANVYPVGDQTTQMQAVMMFDFSMLRDGINVAMSPNFWIRVDNGSALTVQTGDPSTAAGLPLFGTTTSIEFRGRDGGAATVYNSFKGKTFTAGSYPNTLGETNWMLSSPQIAVSPTDTTFIFNGAAIIVSIFAPYPANDGSHTIDQDPTGDPKQFVTSYALPFNKWGSTQPVPIAPRWNVRQSPQVWAPQVNYPATSGTAFWANAETVPDIEPISSWSGPGVPEAFDVTDANVRDWNYGLTGYTPKVYPIVAAPGPAMDGTVNGFGTVWMMYATGYTGNPTGSGTVVGSGNMLPMPMSTTTSAVLSGTALVPSLFTATTAPPGVPAVPGAVSIVSTSGWSMNMANRFSSMVGGLAAAEYTPPFTGSPYWTDTVAALFTTTTFTSGSAGSLTNAQQGTQMITPYDTVLSCMADPSYAHIQGDPRLINNLGEQMTFDTSQNVLSINTPKLETNGPAMILNGPTLSVTSLNGANPKPGSFAYPRTTYQAQFHEMGNHGYIGTLTGYHFSPMWTKTTANLINPRWKNLSSSNAGNPGTSLFAMEGSSGGNGGQGAAQSLFSGIGLDTNAWMQMNPDWDWTSESGSAEDGGYIERPDQDYQTFYLNQTTNINLGTPYFSRSGINNFTAFATAGSSNVTMFAPNRQVPSPVIFGTLPSSMTQGWQTLAFSPNPASVIDSAVNGSGSVAAPAVVNPGVATSAGPVTLNAPTATSSPYSGGVPDHLLLDLFWMPVAEPYPISEQFSTTGKINLNYEMMPFPYIQRKTGLDAVLKSVQIYALPDTASGTQSIPHDYKSWYFMGFSNGNAPAANGRSNPGASTSAGLHSRFPINVDATLNAFDYKFQNGDIFRSASQICDMFLYPNSVSTPNTPVVSPDTVAPVGTTLNISTWWQANGRLTSDNGREAPYNAIYSRITTQSNTYTVHWKVQSLRKVTVNGSQPYTWTDGVDLVTSELRGSTLIERYIDPNAGSSYATHLSNPAIPDNSIPDYADPNVMNWQSLANNPNPITYFYKWRVDNETYFQPGP